MYSGKSNFITNLYPLTRFSKRNEERRLVVRPRGYVHSDESVPLRLLPRPSSFFRSSYKGMMIGQRDLEVVDIAHEEVVAPSLVRDDFTTHEVLVQLVLNHLLHLHLLGLRGVVSLHGLRAGGRLAHTRFVLRGLHCLIEVDGGQLGLYGLSRPNDCVDLIRVQHPHHDVVISLQSEVEVFVLIGQEQNLMITIAFLHSYRVIKLVLEYVARDKGEDLGL